MNDVVRGFIRRDPRLEHQENRIAVTTFVVLACLVLANRADAQTPVPIADPVNVEMLPTGRSELPVNMNAELVYVFSDPTYGNTLHFVGDFVLRQGTDGGLTLRARQAIVWVADANIDGHRAQQLQILLWRNAVIREIAGTVTAGPALFVTLNTTGELQIHADDVAFETSGEQQVYREALRVRRMAEQSHLDLSDASVSMNVLDASGLAVPVKKAKPRPILSFRSKGSLSLVDVDPTRQAITVTQGVYLSRGVPGNDEFLELRADAAVVFLPRRVASPPSANNDGEPQPAGLGQQTPALKRPRAGNGGGGNPDRQLMASALGEMEVEGVYLEGDVRISQGPNSIRASRAYYDLRRDRAVILDAVVQTNIRGRNVPLYLRADEIRLLSRNDYVASEARLTTSEFHTPHYHIGARRIELKNRTPVLPNGQTRGLSAGSFRIRDATLNIGGVPVAYAPFITGSIETSETGVRGLRTGFSDEFGVEIETKWYLFNVLGLETPEGFDGTLALDYFTKRGPAAGVDVTYKRDRYYGLIKSYGILDDERDFLGRDREPAGHSDIRGRLLLRHRQFLENEWELTLEASYISDENFLEEYFEPEFDNGKEQETLLYLKKQHDNWAFTALMQTRPLDFTTQTEHLPDFAYFRVGQPLGGGTWYMESRLGVVRYRPKNQTFREFLRDGRLRGSGTVLRSVSRYELGLPMDLGPWRAVPFVAVRQDFWDDSPAEGSLSRYFGSVGVRASTYLTRVYPDVQSEMLDLHGVRHLVKPSIVAWAGTQNRDADDLFPFEPTVEDIDATSGIQLGVRQRWQTKRGPADARRVVDFLTWDAQVGVFDNADGTARTNGFVSFSRPENSIARNYINSSVIYRVNDRTALLNELNYDINDGEVDILNVSYVVERPPRLSYLIGYRFIEESDSNLLGFDMNYRMTEKHTLALREAFDLERGRTLDFTVALVRRFPRWFSAISFAFDDAEDDFGVSFSLWPEGLPQAALGSRRFTGLATSTRLQNK